MKTTRVEILPYVFLTHLQTDKFKAACLSFNFITQLDRETAAKNALIPRVLLRGCEPYPDMGKIRDRLDLLYGAKLEPMVRKKGEVQCVGLFASFVDDAYLPEGIFSSVAELMGGVLTKPKREGKQLTEQYVMGERKNLIDEIAARINNKGTYALSRMVELMCELEDFSVFKLGSQEQAKNITVEDLTEHYAHLLKTAPIEIFYSGTLDQKTVEKALQKSLGDINRSEPEEDIGTNVRLNSVEAKARYFTEELDVSQGKLSLGFRLGQAMEDPDYIALDVFSALYGGSVNSKLFLHVRERLSLCYYAQSVVEKHKGLLLVASGIEVSKYDEAKGEILAQLQAICDGDITQDELLWAKEAVKTDLAMIKDEPIQLEEFHLQQTLLGEMSTLEERIAQVAFVTKEALMEIAKGIELDAVYFLKGYDEDEGGGL